MMSSTVLKNNVGSVGIAGVGNMGRLMVECLKKNNYKVFCYDPSPKAQEFAQEKGAHVVLNPKELAQNAKLIIMSLPAPKQVFDVIKGENGLIESLSSEHVVVDTSTVSPQTSQEGARLVATKERGDSSLEGTRQHCSIYNP